MPTDSASAITASTGPSSCLRWLGADGSGAGERRLHGAAAAGTRIRVHIGSGQGGCGSCQPGTECGHTHHSPLLLWRRQVPSTRLT